MILRRFYSALSPLQRFGSNLPSSACFGTVPYRFFGKLASLWEPRPVFGLCPNYTESVCRVPEHSTSSRRAFHALPVCASSTILGLMSSTPTPTFMPARFKSTKGKVRPKVYKWRPLQHLRRGSYEARMSTPSGRAILMNRILKGYKYLALSPPA